MGNLSRRLERLERQRAMIASDAPSEAHWREALALQDRYRRLWWLPRWLCEISGAEVAPTLSDLSEEDRAFVEACDAGELKRAEDIERRYRATHPELVRFDTAAWIEGLVMPEGSRAIADQINAPPARTAPLGR